MRSGYTLHLVCYLDGTDRRLGLGPRTEILEVRVSEYPGWHARKMMRELFSDEVRTMTCTAIEQATGRSHTFVLRRALLSSQADDPRPDTVEADDARS